MERTISDFLTSLEFGEIRRHADMAVVPLFSRLDGPEYITLRIALEEELIRVTEVDQEGSILELRVVNRAEVPVLLLDGEELMGAKQNRVVNTTILLESASETIIPVSCTEQGRWAYESAVFDDSGVVMNAALRRTKALTVNKSLRRSRDFHSDQDAVWDEIHELSKKAGFRSSTDAMRDVVDARKDDLREYDRAFEIQPGQKGLFVTVGGRARGLDIVPSELAYVDYHGKLVRSYAMDALLNGVEEGSEDETDDPCEMAREFLQGALCCDEKKYESRGLGWDYRYESGDAVGSALAHEGQVVHTAFFSTDGRERTGRERDPLVELELSIWREQGE